jgi:methyl-accepting chemotaxis protein
MKTIASKLSVPLVAILIVGIAAMMFIINYYLKKSFEEDAVTSLEKTQYLMFTAINAVMKNSEGDSIKKGIKDITDKNDGNIKIIPSKEVFDGNNNEDENQKTVRERKVKKIINSSESIKGIFPYIAKEECLDCHTVSVGTVLGVVEIKIDQKENNTRLRKLQLLFSLLCVGGLIFLILVFSALITFFIKKPLIKIKKEMIDKIIAKNLSFSLTELTNDELGDLGRNLFEMKESQREVIKKINVVSGEVKKTVEYLQTASTEISEGAKHAASEINSVATAGEEMSTTSCDIAQNCHRAAEASQLAVKTAIEGGEILKETIGSMGQISDSVSSTANSVRSLGSRSKQIGAIVGTIEEIADQTNLLALNAAIEAARAGEQGRGFAVVADEVRALAERTTVATREIGEMINTIQKETQIAVKTMEEGVSVVREGTEKAEQSGRALNEIIGQVSGVNDQINQISTAAEEQTATTREISGNMHRISSFIGEVSKGNAENLVAIMELQAVVKELHDHVDVFKI